VGIFAFALEELHLYHGSAACLEWLAKGLMMDWYHTERHIWLKGMAFTKKKMVDDICAIFYSFFGPQMMELCASLCVLEFTKCDLSRVCIYYHIGISHPQARWRLL
jgi:hypothetical protein